MGTSSVVCRLRPLVILSGMPPGRQNNELDKQRVGRYKVPDVGRISSVSTVAREASVIAHTTASATVLGDIILRRGACGHSVFQMSVSVAPGRRPMTLIPFGRNSSRRVLVKPSAPCFDAL